MEKKYIFNKSKNLDGYRLCHLDKSMTFATMSCYAIYKDNRTGYIQYKLMLKNSINNEKRESELQKLKIIIKSAINSNFHYSKGILDIDTYGRKFFLMFHFSVADAMPTVDEVLNLMGKVQETLIENGY